MGNLVGIALPLIEAIAGYLGERKSDIAKDTGLSEDTVGQVSDAVNSYLTKDERAMAAVMAEIDKARTNDSALNTASLPLFVAATRAMICPMITLAAFLWFIYARCAGIELAGEDYAIIGGVLAFWFGFLPFEGQSVTKVTPKVGSGATLGR
jgi:hypothetical protein